VRFHVPQVLLLAALLTLATPRPAQAQGGPCQPLAHQGDDYVVCELDLRRYRLRTFWRGPDGAAIGALDRLAGVA